MTKRRDYEDEVVKVFYVTNATSVQEFQEIATAIRTVAEIRRVFTYNAQKAMVVRGTADQVALAEKLVHDLDKPKSEVVVDVLVLETNSQCDQKLRGDHRDRGNRGSERAHQFHPAQHHRFGGHDRNYRDHGHHGGDHHHDHHADHVHQFLGRAQQSGTLVFGGLLHLAAGRADPGHAQR